MVDVAALGPSDASYAIKIITKMRYNQKWTKIGLRLALQIKFPIWGKRIPSDYEEKFIILTQIKNGN